MRSVVVAMLILVISGCTSVGGFTQKPVATPGNGFTLRVCVLRDAALPEATVNGLFSAWQEELAPLGIRPVVSGVSVLPRPSFTAFGAFRALEQHELGPDCDRLTFLVGRTAGDALYGIASIVIGMPEMYGAVDDLTHTRMYVVAETVTPLHMMFGGARQGLIHEGYHLLGCGHWSWSDCYRQIDKLKQLARDRPTDFIPALTETGRVFMTREEADQVYGHPRPTRAQQSPP
jgi:hypothetical protein